ncbi:MAG TPA: hypothetical protein VLZ81_00445 [Blastocatellia bacterium]|nr:hypothetical protein [Blastocatellia bacterium]
MRRFFHPAVMSVFCVVLIGCAAVLLSSPAHAQQLAKRLILKDGSYQSAIKWEVKGDRVRYLSAERNEWEELPYSLVDWAATDKYEKDRASGSAPPEAREVDKEVEAERAEEEAATPLVALNLRLPDFEGAFVLDTFQGQPELVELEQNTGEINRNTKDNLLHAAINPIASSKETIELAGPHAKVQAHTTRPSFFINAGQEDDTDTKVHTDPQSANSQPQQPAGASDKAHGPQQAQQPDKAQQARFDVLQHYRIIRADVKKDNRVVGNIKIAVYGKVSQHQNFIPTIGEKFSGNWVKVTPAADLAPGEYALVEMLGEKGMNLYLWDFGVNPDAPANPSAWKPETPVKKTDDKPPTLDKRN